MNKVKLFKISGGGGLKIKTISSYVLPILIIGVTFFLLRTFSIKIFSFTGLDDLTYLIYLPAGIRLLAVAIFGWIGILGIMLGWFFCHVFGGEKGLFECLFIGFISGLVAYISFRVWQVCFNINSALDGLNSRLAIFLILISAVISSYTRFLYLNIVDPLTTFMPTFLVGLSGDIFGAFIVLYFIKGLLYLTRRFYVH